MKTFALALTILASLLCMPSRLEAAASPSVLLKFEIYSLPLSEGVDFLITKNPSGNPSQTLDAIEGLARAGKATHLDSVTITGDSGQHLKGESRATVVETEIVVSPDRSAINIMAMLTVEKTQLLGSQTVSFGNVLFNGAMKSADGNNLIVAYVTPFLK